LGERLNGIQEVGGSTPLGSTKQLRGRVLVAAALIGRSRRSASSGIAGVSA
jgi:hypothetical protein